MVWRGMIHKACEIFQWRDLGVAVFTFGVVGKFLKVLAEAGGFASFVQSPNCTKC